VIPKICLDWGKWDKWEKRKPEKREIMLFKGITPEEGKEVTVPFPVDTRLGTEFEFRGWVGVRKPPTHLREFLHE